MSGVATYRRAQENVEDPRRIEIMMLQRVNLQMQEADTKGPVDRLYAAWQNRRLWSAFRLDILAQDMNGSGLPPELKARLINISFWVDNFHVAVQKQDKPLDPMVKINEMIIDGLRQSIDMTKKAVAPAPGSAPESGGMPRPSLGSISA